MACTLGTVAPSVTTVVGVDGVVAVFSRLLSLLIALVTLLNGSGGVGSLRATSLHFSTLGHGWLVGASLLTFPSFIAAWVSSISRSMSLIAASACWFDFPSMELLHF